MNRTIRIFGIAAVCLLLLTGCGPAEGAAEPAAFAEPMYDWDKSSGEKLVVWGAEPDLDRIYIRKAFDRYCELTGNELSVIQMPKEEFGKRMEEAFLGDGEKPDVIFSYGGENIAPYIPEESFYDFSDAVWVNDLTDNSINQTIYGGKVIGLPFWEASVSGTLYNRKIFAKYGLEVPETQKEFLALCKTLLSKGITPLYMPGKEISMLLYQFPLDTLIKDAPVLEALNNGSLTYAELEGMVEVVEWYRHMAQSGYLGETYLTDDWNGMNAAMVGGEYAMMLCWDTWLYTDFQGKAENFGLMPAFVGVPEEGTFEGPNLGLFLVNRQSGKLESALNFITFLADPYNYNIAFEGVYTAPVFKNQVKSIATPQYVEAERLIDRLYHDSTAWLRIKGFSQMDAACIVEYMSAENGGTAKECLQKMDALRKKRLEQ